MSAAALLERLEGVRSTGHGRWIARCPAHDDKRPSLSIREGDTGAVLAYCWSGCTIAEIAAAAGLNLSDLFPPRRQDLSEARAHSNKPRVSSLTPLTPLVAMFEADLIIAHVFLSDVAAGKPISDDDRAAAGSAAARLWDALQGARRAV